MPRGWQYIYEESYSCDDKISKDMFGNYPLAKGFTASGFVALQNEQGSKESAFDFSLTCFLGVEGPSQQLPALDRQQLDHWMGLYFLTPVVSVSMHTICVIWSVSGPEETFLHVGPAGLLFLRTSPQPCTWDTLKIAIFLNLPTISKTL